MELIKKLTKASIEKDFKTIIDLLDKKRVFESIVYKINKISH
jgi:hypothetical protein